MVRHNHMFRNFRNRIYVVQHPAKDGRLPNLQ